jgi:ABC-type nitrate/sulfonate/bicarbonate transport system substrate-binding protein
MNNHRVLILLVISFFLCGLAACKRDNGILTARVGYLPMVSSLTYFVAVENKYFIDEKLDIQATPIKTSNAIAQDLAAGHIDAAIELSIVPLLKTIAGKEPKFRVFSISSITEENGFDAVIVLKDSPIQTLADLSGKKVGTFPGTTAAATFGSVFAAKFPGKPLPVFQQIDPSVHLQSLASGDVDALHAYEPTVTIGTVEKGYRKVAGSIYGMQLTPSPIGVAAVNSDWLEKNAKAAKALLRALDRAVRFIDSNPDEARRILAKYTGATPEVTQKMMIMPMSESTRINQDNLQNYLDILTSIKETDAPVTSRTIVLK